MLIATPFPIDPFSSEYYQSYVLKEKLHDIQKDVDMIYDLFFRGLITAFQRYGTLTREDCPEPQESYLRDAEEWGVTRTAKDTLFGGLVSSQLKTRACREADKELSVPIFCGSFSVGSYHYFPKSQKIPPHIAISTRSELFNALLDSGEGLEKIVSPALLKRASNEFTEARMKATIAHELSHWIDNAKYNVFELIIGDSTSPDEKKAKLLLGKKNVNMTYFEIQGQIHAIHQIYLQNKDTWNTLTLNDVFLLLPSLQGIAIQLYEKYGEEVLDVWIKYVLKRLGREKLLGKNMSSFSITRLNEMIERSIYTIH